MFRKLISASLVAALMAGTASADTLRDALVSAYQTNPTLTAQRENFEATDANVAIARAAGRPQVSGTVGLNRDLTRSGILDTGGNGPNAARPGWTSATLCSTAAAVKNSVRAAKTRVEAGRATLRAVEGDVFTQAVTGLHGRDPRPRDRRAEPEQRAACSKPTSRRRATASRSAISPAPTSPSPKRGFSSAARSLPTRRAD